MAEEKKNLIRVPVEPIPQMRGTGTEPYKILHEDLLNDFGDSGTPMTQGLLYDDPNTKLTGMAGMEIFDEMRKTSAPISIVLNAVKLPIISTERTIDCESDDPKQKEIRDRCREVLFKRLDNPRHGLIREILSFFDFGFSLFEKVYTMRDGKIELKKLGFRKQSTILKRETEQGQPGVIQQLYNYKQEGKNSGDNQISIPSAKLVRFTFKQEGDNYAGESLLRPIYKNRYMLDKLVRFDAILQERLSMPLPILYKPANATPKQGLEAKKVVERYRNREQGGVIMPGSKAEGRELEFPNHQMDKASNIQESIKQHNREIFMQGMAQFLLLGTQSQSGSRALSEDHSDLFLLSLEAAATYICDVFNRYIIPELVNLNYDVEEYPTLRFAKIGSIDYNKFTGSIKSMIDSGAINTDEELEKHIRSQLDLPEPSEGKGDNGVKSKRKYEKVSESKGKKSDDESIAASEPCNHGHEPELEFDEYYMKLSGYFSDEMITRLQNESVDEKSFTELKKKGLRLNRYKGYRPLTFAERKVNLSSIKAAILKFEKRLQDELTGVTNKMKQDMLKQVKKAVEQNDMKALGKISSKYSSEVKKSIAAIQKEMFDMGKQSAAVEMSVRVPPTKKEVSALISVQSGNMARAISNDIDSKTRQSVSEMIQSKGGISATTPSEAVQVAGKAIDNITTRSIAGLRTISVTGSINLGRKTVFERYPEQIYAIQYSAILDERTSKLCLSLDGRIVKKGSAEFYRYTPPNHPNCRSIRVEILHDELIKPKVSGIPSSIPSGSVTSPAILKTPILKAGSPAIRVIQEEINIRKKKLQEYKDKKIFPNRQKQHIDAIQRLSRSVEKKFSEMIYQTTKMRLEKDGFVFKNK